MKLTKTEVTIEQLKEILQPMGTHLLITQDGFKVNEKDNVSWVINNRYAYELTLCKAHKELINNPGGAYKVFKDKQNAIKYHDEYLLKDTYIRFESDEEALLYHEAEVKRLQSLIEEENKPKVGDWAMLWEDDEETPVFGLITDVTDFYLTCNGSWENGRKITDQELINKLNELIK